MAKLADNLFVWAGFELAVMFGCGWVTSELLQVANMDAVARSLTPTTVLLSVALGVSVQLWSKLNDLSALTQLASEERTRLNAQVKLRVRSIVYLVTFFVAFILFVLVAAAMSTSSSNWAQPMVIASGAGLGACMVLIAALLVDLNEVAEFRWQVEGAEQERKRRESLLGRINQADEGFRDDEHIQNFKRVVNHD